MPKDFDTLIAQKNSEAEAARSRMLRLNSDFLDSAIAFTKEWYREKVNRAVTDSPDHTVGLGRERLAELKQKLADLIESAEQRVSENLEQVGGLVFTDSPEQADAPTLVQKSIQDALRFSMGETGRLLMEFGYKSDEYEHKPSNKKWRYRYGFDWSDPMKEAHRKAREAELQHRRARDEVEKLGFEKNQDQAKGLWDSV